MTGLERLERILDLHFFDPHVAGNVSFAGDYNNQKRAFWRALGLGADTLSVFLCQPVSPVFSKPPRRFSGFFTSHLRKSHFINRVTCPIFRPGLASELP